MNRNVVRTVAIALIAFPEPVTTFVGILILSATFAVPSQESLQRYGDLEELVNRSLLKVEPPVGFRRYLVPNQPVVNHVIKLNWSLQYEKVSEKSETVPISLDCHSWFDNRKLPEKTLHHTLRTSFPQYEAVPEVRQNSNLKSIILKNNQPGVEHHKLKQSLFPETIDNNARIWPNKSATPGTLPATQRILKVS